MCEHDNWYIGHAVQIFCSVPLNVIDCVIEFGQLVQTKLNELLTFLNLLFDLKNQ